MKSKTANEQPRDCERDSAATVVRPAARSRYHRLLSAHERRELDYSQPLKADHSLVALTKSLDTMRNADTSEKIEKFAENGFTILISVEITSGIGLALQSTKWPIRQPPMRHQQQRVQRRRFRMGPAGPALVQ
ncbi:MAG: hypothetical protein GY791_00735 [Alphaproteobacteria bacterium]|nr:hypothetical protein [Alphaproteobacteria bacterium]